MINETAFQMTNLSPTLRILADENIPLVREAFGCLGTVRLVPGRAITPEDVRDADVLLVRSVTRVDAALIAGSSLRFVGSATIGTDHIDHAALQAQGVPFAHAPGSNAESVVEYVLTALLRLSTLRGEALRGKTVGIVGCGNIGGRLAERLTAFGVTVLKNDPPLAEQAEQHGEDHDFVALADVLAGADVVTLHVPLTRDGAQATHHLFDKTTLDRLKPGAWLLNSSRGAIVSNTALYDVMRQGRPGAVVLDVWENEPTPMPELLRRVDFATPHIAGYSYDGKAQGTVMLYRALLRRLDLSPAWDEQTALDAGPEDDLVLHAPDPVLSETAWLDALAHQMYDLSADDARLRDLLKQPPEEHGAFFSALRKHYPRRRTFRLHTLARRAVPDAYQAVVERGLRVPLMDG